MKISKRALTIIADSALALLIIVILLFYFSSTASHAGVRVVSFSGTDMKLSVPEIILLRQPSRLERKLERFKRECVQSKVSQQKRTRTREFKACLFVLNDGYVYLANYIGENRVELDLKLNNIHMHMELSIAPSDTGYIRYIAFPSDRYYEFLIHALKEHMVVFESD